MGRGKHRSISESVIGTSGSLRYLQKLADKMRAGMKHVDAVNEILQEEDPGPPFDLPKRRSINDVLFRTEDAAKIVRHYEPAEKWIVKSLDVWGNEDDGFEINQEFHAGDIEIPVLTDDAGLLKLLKENDFLKSNVRLNQVEFDDSGAGLIEVKDAKTGEPLYLLYGPS